MNNISSLIKKYEAVVAGIDPYSGETTNPVKKAEKDILEGVIKDLKQIDKPDKSKMR